MGSTDDLQHYRLQFEVSEEPDAPRHREQHFWARNNTSARYQVQAVERTYNVLEAVLHNLTTDEEVPLWTTTDQH